MERSMMPIDKNQFSKTRNYLAYQQAVFIALINKQFRVIIQRPVKKAIVTHQFLNIRLLQKEKDIIEVDTFVQGRCQQRRNHDITSGVSMSAAKQRVGKNKIIELNLLLLDILNMFGYTFSTEMSEGKNGAMRNEMCKTVFYNGNYLFGKEEISVVGAKINKYLCEALGNRNEITVDYNDPALQNYLNELIYVNI
ncbi:hypothetical protein EIN_052690 [Entamoeba invadens IP1]|uniref:hypothetical protein n=1 Tax=Entamoeba invadens IP1 TaxID=370355 RepID=UPI0002C3D1AC|nr:hypothetical protein EIN_052690 [Entamoeba invadens IP1]ELP93054.1 hypothetical protein EIN_052690 [Entamoeba invadens IP1]|eukprot:XP_004259825.1 hypothetical protein EIN_052690 [Entamoeba invadens IP1]